MSASQVVFLNHQVPVCISNRRHALFKIYNLIGRPQVWLHAKNMNLCSQCFTCKRRGLVWEIVLVIKKTKVNKLCIIVIVPCKYVKFRVQKLTINKYTRDTIYVLINTSLLRVAWSPLSALYTLYNILSFTHFSQHMASHIRRRSLNMKYIWPTLM